MNWNDFKRDYRDVAELIEEVTPDPNGPVWNSLWERLYHSGSFSGSFAALPFLLEKAASWPPQNRSMILYLASSIVASTEYDKDYEPLRTQQEWTFTKFYELTLEALAVTDLPKIDFCYFLSSARAFTGDRIWARALDGCHEGEFY